MISTAQLQVSDTAPIATIGIVGAGFMGARLALHVAAHGYPVAVAEEGAAR